MKHKTIGASELVIAPIALGGNVFGWTVDEKQSFDLLDTFMERGFNCVDTADVYARFVPGLSGGESETIIGRWFALGGGRRERTVLCTKVGMEMQPGKKGLSAAHIEAAADSSLKRLQTDYIDLYISHIDDPEIGIEETLRAYDKLMQAGKVRVIGASNFSAARLASALDLSDANGLPKYQSLQPLYNLYDRGAFEGELEQLCVQRKLSVFPYFALASGFLAGKYRNLADLEGRPRREFVKHYLDERGTRILAAMDQIATRLACTLTQMALAWLLSHPDVTAPIASATDTSQLGDILGSVDVKLGTRELRELNAASAVSVAT